MSTKAYGSITIVDISDIGTLSVVPESNQPKSIIYDPSTNAYNPTWSSLNKLELKPVIYYGASPLSVTNGTPSVTWYRKIGTASFIKLENSDGADSNTGILTISSNTYPSATNPIVTYKCEVTYSPIAGTDLKASGEITFDVLSLPQKIYSAKITGVDIFKQNGQGAIEGKTEITLTPNFQGGAGYLRWEYKKNGTTWTTLTFNEGGGNCTIASIGSNITLDSKTCAITIKQGLINDSTSAAFVSNRAEFKLISTKPGIEDTCTIMVIKDGAAGGDSLNATLSNEDIWIPCDANGDPLKDEDGISVTKAFADAKTTITVYNGNDNVTASAKIEISSNGVEGNYNSNTYTYKVDNFTNEVNSGSVTFTVTYNGKTIIRVFNLTKLKAGDNGVTPIIYSVKLDPIALQASVDENGDIVSVAPNKVTATAYSQSGIDTPEPANVLFSISSLNAAGQVASTENIEASSSTYEKSFESSNPTYPAYKILIYAPTDTNRSKPLDSQTFTIIKDGTPGENGQPGPEGTPGLSFLLFNYSDSFSCDHNGKTTQNETITIPFTAYWGSTQLACTATTSTLPTGWGTPNVTNGTNGTNGEIKIAIPSGINLTSGTIDITITITDTRKINNQTVTNKTSKMSYSWSVVNQPEDGAAAIFLRTWAPAGNIIANGENDVLLQAELFDGNVLQDIGNNYKWSKWDASANNGQGGYVIISGENSKTYTVDKDSVEGYASFRVIATYNGDEYTDYISVQDKTDPLQVTIKSSLADKIINSEGEGCIYAIVELNGVELDPMQNLKIQTAQPTTPSQGDVWVDISTQQANIKKYSGSQWETMAEADFECSYEWDFTSYATNVNGLSLDKFNNNVDKHKKFLYVNGTLINKKTQFNLEVEKKS